MIFGDVCVSLRCKFDNLTLNFTVLRRYSWFSWVLKEGPEWLRSMYFNSLFCSPLFELFHIFGPPGIRMEKLKPLGWLANLHKLISAETMSLHRSFLLYQSIEFRVTILFPCFRFGENKVVLLQTHFPACHGLLDPLRHTVFECFSKKSRKSGFGRIL